MKELLKEILADPITGQELIEEKRDGEEFLSSQNNIYPVLENIPVLLPDRIKKNTNSPLHSQFNSEFNYAVHYNEDANRFDYFKEEESRTTKEETRRLHEAIIKRIPTNADLILDVGCGNGWAAKYFLSKGKKVVSMDISIKNPTKVLKENPGENHVAVVADGYYLPFKKNGFDAIIASEILEHVYDPKLFIIKLLEVLKPGGRLILTTPYNEKIEYYLCVHCNKPTPKNAHLHSFNEKNIATFIPEEAGDFKMDKFSNKYLVRLRLNLLTSFLPFGLWKFKDAVANLILEKPLRFLIELKKK